MAVTLFLFPVLAIPQGSSNIRSRPSRRLMNVLVADHTQDDTMAGMARRALAAAHRRVFALAGLSMGGYVAMEIMRQAPERVERLALLDTSAQPDSPRRSESRGG